MSATATATPPAVRTAPASRFDTLRHYLSARKDAISAVMSTAARIEPAQFVALLLTDISRSPKLLECSPESIYMACRQVASLGLAFGSNLGHAYLVPYKGTATLIVGYRGLVHVAVRCGAVKSMRARVVHEQDEFELREGSSPSIHHVPYWRGDPGTALGAYCSWVLPDGSTDFVFMRIDEIDSIRARSPGAQKPDSPWNSPDRTVREEMAKKTAIRRGFKALAVQTIEQARQLAEVDSAADEDSPGVTIDTTGVVSSMADHAPPASASDQLADAIAGASKDQLAPMPAEVVDQPLSDEDEGLRADTAAALEDIASGATGKKGEAIAKEIQATLAKHGSDSVDALPLEPLRELYARVEAMR